MCAICAMDGRREKVAIRPRKRCFEDPEVKVNPVWKRGNGSKLR